MQWEIHWSRKRLGSSRKTPEYIFTHTRVSDTLLSPAELMCMFYVWRGSLSLDPWVPKWKKVLSSSSPGCNVEVRHIYTRLRWEGVGVREGRRKRCLHFSRLLPPSRSSRRVQSSSAEWGLGPASEDSTREKGQKIKYSPQWGRAETQGEKKTVSNICLLCCDKICCRDTRQFSSQRSAALI